MERLVGNIWIHDPGTGEVSFYERIGRNQRPLRVESEELPDRIPFEAQQIIKQRMQEMRTVLDARTPKQVRLANLETALALFPAYVNGSPAEKQHLLDSLCEGLPDHWEAPVREPQGLPREPTVEETVDKANKAKQQELSDLAAKETEILQLKEQLAMRTREPVIDLTAQAAAQDAELEALKVQLAKQDEIARLQAELAARNKDNEDGKETQVPPQG